MYKVFVDTNILLYSMDKFNPEKQSRCRTLLARLTDELRGVISTQVMQKFYVAATKKLGVDALLARIFHESPAATTDMAVLPGVLGCLYLRRTVQVCLGTNTLRLPGGTPIFAVSRQQFMKYPG